MGWASLASKGALGGIIVMWDKIATNLVEYLGEYLVSCSFINVDDGFGWGFAGVYGPNIDSERSFLWDEIAGLCSQWDGLWCIGGGFNITWFPSERLDDSHISSAMADFLAQIFYLDLVDLPLARGDFTWLNGRAWSRLDRFILSSSWEEHFPDLCQKRLPRLCSDHFPIVLDCGVFMRGGDTLNLDSTDIKDHIVHFYNKLLMEQYLCRLKVEGLVYLID
ncbi:hypothetical protein I3760_10G044500 [Carya illinoinensis]|uniref:Endonuclease/exonuclease/phosphatase domain-containing protein n=1 Tax=Carya illinoinensis TaxID=32201 RepID=A0A922DVM7_CARIL|nr:hypothetical protein I3760_10G044500 [Carya illinoinensis]KAG6691037.1 hypothetical protein I3842_10G044100 [Carya illinoinensis]